MKTTLIIILIGAAVLMEGSILFLRRDLANAKKQSASIEERNNFLEKELMRLNRVSNDKERTLSEINETIIELESKIPLETLERYIPKKTWDEIKPIVDRLQAFQEAKEKNILSIGETNGK